MRFTEINLFGVYVTPMSSIMVLVGLGSNRRRSGPQRRDRTSVTLPTGSRTNTDTCPLSPKLTVPCGIATSFALNLDSAFDAGYIDSAAHFFSRIRPLWSYPRLEQVSS